MFGLGAGRQQVLIWGDTHALGSGALGASPVSNALQRSCLDRVGVVDVAGVSRGGGLEEHDAAFVLGDGFVLDAAGDDAELAFAEGDDAIPKVQVELAGENEEHLVLIRMVMPDVLAFELDEFDVLTVEFAGDFGGPVVGEGGEFGVEVNGIHNRSFFCRHAKIPRVLR